LSQNRCVCRKESCFLRSLLNAVNNPVNDYHEAFLDG
jgi:hypothetical protein